MRNADMPAMPFCPTQDRHEKTPGITKREYFAALAMQGMLAGPNGDSDIHASGESWVSDIAEASVEFADALLAELEHTGGGS